MASGLAGLGGTLAMILALAVGVGVYVAHHDRGKRADHGTGEPPASDRVATASPEAAEVISALAGLATDPDSLVAEASKEQVAGHAVDALPAGATITAHEDSWSPDGLGGGVIAVTIAAPGREPVTYLAVMVLETGGWKVLATAPLDEDGDA